MYSEMYKRRSQSVRGLGDMKYLWAWLASMGIFLLCEMLIDESACYSVWISLDDLIPFSEFFVIFYVLWYFLILGTILYLAKRNARGFSAFLKYMTICQLLAVVIFLVFPNKQELRPETIMGDNVFLDLVRIIHSVDTNTNVCPSLHVCYSLALASVWLREGRWVITKITYVILAILISLSTIFIKQHSVLDIFVALPVCLIAEMATCYIYKDKNEYLSS